MKAEPLLILATILTLMVVFWGLQQSERLGRLHGWIECRAAQVEAIRK
jgi:hypothetical protein